MPPRCTWASRFPPPSHFPLSIFASETPPSISFLVVKSPLQWQLVGGWGLAGRGSTTATENAFGGAFPTIRWDRRGFRNVISLKLSASGMHAPRAPIQVGEVNQHKSTHQEQGKRGLQNCTTSSSSKVGNEFDRRLASVVDVLVGDASLEGDELDHAEERADVTLQVGQARLGVDIPGQRQSLLAGEVDPVLGDHETLDEVVVSIDQLEDRLEPLLGRIPQQARRRHLNGNLRAH